MAAKSLGDLRRALGMSQTTLASRMGCSQSWISKLENSDNPQMQHLIRYVNSLGCTLYVDIRLGTRLVLSFRSEPEHSPPLGPAEANL